MNTPVVIFSVERAELPADANALRTSRARAYLEAAGVDFARVQGAYQGVQEVGFLVVAEGGDGGHAFEVAERIASEYGQESILYVDSKGYAYLHYLERIPERNGEVEPIGRIVEVRPEDRGDAYTILPDGRHVVARRA